MPDWLSAWWFALGPAVTLIVLLGVVQACRMRRHKTEALRQSWRDRGEVPVWLLLIVLAVLVVAGITGHIPLTDPVDTP